MFRNIGKIAGVVAAVALIGSGIGSALGGTMMFTALGSSIAASTIATVAGAISAVAMTAANLTAKKPRAQGAINNRMIGASNLMPYLMGLAFSAGVQVVDEGYGGKVGKVDNPYSFTGVVHSCCGPCDGIDSYLVDWNEVSISGGAASGYYANFLYVMSQLGLRPEPGVLTPQWVGCPNWGSDYKLSSMFATGWSMKFDKKGKVFAAGQPPFGIVGRGVWAYDPRLDSTFPGGSGPQRVDDESTWAYTRNPALHAGTYAYGRWVNGKLVFGVDLGDTVNFGAIAAWANLCDANGWTVNGTIYEPGDRWNNLKKICLAGGGEPILAGGEITFSWHAPRIALDTIRADDLAPGPLGSTAGRGWTDRINTLRPKFRSPAHQWSDTPADAVKVPEFVTADGEEKSEEYVLELVTDVDQGAELSLYEIWKRREAGPFTVTVGPRLQAYRPGDVLTLPVELELWPVEIDALIVSRSNDPATGYSTLELEGETPAKHAAALGATGSVSDPVTPPAPGAADGVAGSNGDPYGYVSGLIATSFPVGMTVSATDDSITVSNHWRSYSDSDALVAVTGTTIASGIDAETIYYGYYDDGGRAGGAVSWHVTEDYFEAQTSVDHPDRHYGFYITTDAPGGSGTTGGGPPPPGGGGPYNPYEP